MNEKLLIGYIEIILSKSPDTVKYLEDKFIDLMIVFCFDYLIQIEYPKEFILQRIHSNKNINLSSEIINYMFVKDPKININYFFQNYQKLIPEVVEYINFDDVEKVCYVDLFFKNIDVFFKIIDKISNEVWQYVLGNLAYSFKHNTQYKDLNDKQIYIIDYAINKIDFKDSEEYIDIILLKPVLYKKFINSIELNISELEYTLLKKTEVYIKENPDFIIDYSKEIVEHFKITDKILEIIIDKLSFNFLNRNNKIHLKRFDIEMYKKYILKVIDIFFIYINNIYDKKETITYYSEYHRLYNDSLKQVSKFGINLKNYLNKKILDDIKYYIDLEQFN